MGRRRNMSIAANPILIGGVTVLMVIVAVYLSYNANHGLPFVPTYKVKVVIPNADGLIAGNEVRIGGERAGVVKKIDALSNKDGSTAAELELGLDANTSHLPVDTVVKVRPKSSLGLKYVAITRGSSSRQIASGGTITVPKSQAPAVDIDQFFNMFDEQTRAGSAGNLLEYGTGFAGRGGDINTALQNLDPLVRHGEPALDNLLAARTQLDRLFPALGRTAAEVAPVARTQGELFGNLNHTFAALADNSRSLEQSIALGPEALDVATAALPAQAGFEEDSTELFRRLKEPFRQLAAASTHLAPAFKAGTPALKVSPELNARVVQTLDALDTFVGDARVLPALQRLTETANLLNPIIAFATPLQTTCNGLSLFFRNIGSALSESDVVGTFLRANPIVTPTQPNSEDGPSSAPANGPKDLDFAKIDDSYLRSNPYPNTAAPGQTDECEAGNETIEKNAYTKNQQAIGNVPGNQGTFVDKTSIRGLQK
jgi:ABC-type transporter Mla subunit MlaD